MHRSHFSTTALIALAAALSLVTAIALVLVTSALRVDAADAATPMTHSAADAPWYPWSSAG